MQRHLTAKLKVYAHIYCPGTLVFTATVLPLASLADGVFGTATGQSEVTSADMDACIRQPQQGLRQTLPILPHGKALQGVLAASYWQAWAMSRGWAWAAAAKGWQIP